MNLIRILACMLLIVFSLPALAKGSTVLKIEMSPALCDMEGFRKSLKSCVDGFSISVAGLSFNEAPRGRCSSQPVKLSPLQTRIVGRVMPDVSSQDESWQLYGSCAGLSSKDYFRLITDMTAKLRLPKELSSGRSYLVDRNRFMQQFFQLNANMPKGAVELSCRKHPTSGTSVLTELQVCYDSASRFAACPVVTAQKCPESFQVRGLGR